MSDHDLAKKDARSLAQQATTGKKSNVFDTAGNDAIKSRIAEVEAESGASAQSKSSLLDKVEKQAQSESAGKSPAETELATQQALKNQAVQARDEVVLQVQTITSNADILQQLQQCESIYQASTVVVEMVAMNVADDDMAALAAYSHHDLMQGKILSPESHLETRGVSGQARKMGGFVPILWQLVTDQMVRADLKLGGGADSETPGPMMSGGGAAAPTDPRAIAAPLMRAARVLSAARSSSIV